MATRLFWSTQMMTSAQMQLSWHTWVNEVTNQEHYFSGGMVPLYPRQFVEAVRQAMSAAHLPVQDYAGHSFRIGAATTAAMAGVQDSTIQTLG